MRIISSSRMWRKQLCGSQPLRVGLCAAPWHHGFLPSRGQYRLLRGARSVSCLWCLRQQLGHQPRRHGPWQQGGLKPAVLANHAG